MHVNKASIHSKMPIQGINFVIPPFQRAYSWEKENWEELFNDLKLVIDKNTHHFIGSVVIQKKGLELIVIDGQQRLTTISLLLLALAKWTKKHNVGNKYFYENIIKDYLVVTKRDGSQETRFKLSNKNNNLKEFENLVLGFYKENFVPAEIQEKTLVEVVNFFEKELNEFNKKFQPTEDFEGTIFDKLTQNLNFIDIELEENEDANTIFETLNSRGKQLDSSDLIRNYLFMMPQIKKVGEMQVYENNWYPLEKYFEDLAEQKIKHSFSNFLKYFLFANVTRPDTIHQDRIYPEMKEFLTKFLENNSIAALFDKLKKYKNFFDIIIFPDKIDVIKYNSTIKIGLKIINYCDVFVSTPLILKAFELFDNKKIQKDTLENIILLLASYTLRLVVHERKFPNKTLPTLIKLLENFEDENELPQKIANEIVKLKATPFYNDEDFKSRLLEYEIYENRRRDLVRYLIWLAIYQHSEGKLGYTNFEDLSIEHIFPQKAEQSDLSDEEFEETKKLSNTIGNLTLLTQKLNSSLSNKPFAEKKAKLQEYTIWNYERENYFSQDQWTSQQITDRTEFIADQIIKLLPNAANAQDSTEYVWKVEGELVEGKNQKAQFINALQKMYSLATPTWHLLAIKGIANKDKTAFTQVVQQRGLVEIQGVFFNSHASLSSKQKRLQSIAEKLNLHFEVEIL